ncbi:protein-(glutamine-N5) methyltransferase, release factor-specific, partial [Candidatus Uhrbacteria bacterium]|nr:protein-(glutamine-N5) methyltransferase, release factor-specific [Candidatus Uhrbacteria bacterium]
MTRKELLKKIVSELGHADHAIDDARQILMHVLNISHADFLAHDDLEVTRGQRSKATKLAKARSQHTPMAYLLGSREFFGRSFPVNKHTLISRPETELMVEEAVALSSKDTQFIDVGTGSGAIAITLNLETAQPVIGVD